jgi:hypothetical protein
MSNWYNAHRDQVENTGTRSYEDAVRREEERKDRKEFKRDIITAKMLDNENCYTK